MTRVHVSLQTADLAASTAFYAALFGAPPDKVRDGYARFQPADVPVTLSLSPGTPSRGAHHFGVKLARPEAVADALTRLTAAGLVRAVEQGTTCCHAVQDKVWVADPDGRDWEVYAVTDDAPGIARSAESTCCAVDAGCCA